MTSEQDVLEFEGEKVGTSTLKLTGNVAMNGDRKLRRHARVGFIGQAVVSSVSFKGDGAATREHASGIEEARLVPLTMVEDLTNELKEQETGQMRLLSLDGERKRAARAILAERTRAAEELGFGIEHLDEKDAITGARDFGDYIATHQLNNIETLVEGIDGGQLRPDEWYAAFEHEMIQAAGVMLAGVEWARRRRWDVLEADRLAKEEEDRRRIAAAVGASAVHSKADGEIDVDSETGQVLSGDDRDEDGDIVRNPSTPGQAYWIEVNLRAVNDKLLESYETWLEHEGIPAEPDEMTFEQAKAVLEFIGDKTNAEAQDAPES